MKDDVRQRKDRTDLDYYKKNIELLSGYFKAGEKQGGRKTGIEIEHFLTRNGKNVGYDEVCKVLKSLQSDTDTEITDDGKYFGYYNDDYSITLEPASQLEISITPTENSEDALRIYRGFMDRFKAAADFEIHTVGTHPTEKAADLTLIPKARYKYMDAYFKHTGKHGINMMRASASAQISIDYFNELDFERKFLLANILAPIFALLTDNAPIYEGEPNYTPVMRAHIWRDVDEERCRIAPSMFDFYFGYKKYAELIYNCPLILYEENGVTKDAKGKSASEIYADRELTKDEMEHIMSMVFYAVRAKTYIEIRPADSMPIEYVLEYNELIRAIFYNDERMDFFLEWLDCFSAKDIEAAFTAVMTDGYAATVYNEPVKDVVYEIFRGMEEKCPKLYALAKEGKTLREKALEMRKDS